MRTRQLRQQLRRQVLSFRGHWCASLVLMVSALPACGASSSGADAGGSDEPLGIGLVDLGGGEVTDLIATDDGIWLAIVDDTGGEVRQLDRDGARLGSFRLDLPGEPTDVRIALLAPDRLAVLSISRWSSGGFATLQALTAAGEVIWDWDPVRDPEDGYTDAEMEFRGLALEADGAGGLWFALDLHGFGYFGGIMVNVQHGPWATFRRLDGDGQLIGDHVIQGYFNHVIGIAPNDDGTAWAWLRSTTFLDTNSGRGGAAMDLIRLDASAAAVKRTRLADHPTDIYDGWGDRPVAIADAGTPPVAVAFLRIPGDECRKSSGCSFSSHLAGIPRGFALVQFDDDGDVIDVVPIPATDAVESLGIAVDRDGRVVIVGQPPDDESLAMTSFLEGERFDKRISVTHRVEPQVVQTDSEGRLWVAGGFEGRIKLGETEIGDASEDQRAFVAWFDSWSAVEQAGEGLPYQGGCRIRGDKCARCFFDLCANGNAHACVEVDYTCQGGWAEMVGCTCDAQEAGDEAGAALCVDEFDDAWKEANPGAAYVADCYRTECPRSCGTDLW